MSKEKSVLNKAYKYALEPTTAVERAYAHVRDIAIAFAMRPGEQINEVEIAEKLEMSRVPVREALNRLLVEEFVFFDPGKGFFCRRFSQTEMRDLYSVRFDLEMSAVREACQKGDTQDITEIMAAWETIAETDSSLSIDEIILLDETFHLDIAHLAGNQERPKLLHNIYQRIRYVRKISIENEKRRQSIVEDHLHLMQAILDRDENKSTELLRRHLGVNSEELESNINTGMMRIFASEIT